MNKLVWIFAVIAAAALPLLHTAPAHAQNTAWVSVTGTNANNTSCGQENPCYTLGAALSAISAGGEVHCIDPYLAGSAMASETITFSVTIDCSGGIAQLMVSNSSANFVINAPNSIVTLRGLTLDGQSDQNVNMSKTPIGIDIKSAATVNIEDCVIANFEQTGIYDERTSGGAQLFIKNTILRDNGSSSLSGGIDIAPGSGVTASVSIDHSYINGNYFGIVGDGRSGGTISATISDSVVSGNAQNGITVISSGSSVVFMIDQTKVTGNAAAGLYAGGSNAGMLARNTTVFKNGYGLDIGNGGALYSYGNNSVAGNGTNGAFTATVGQQ